MSIIVIFGSHVFMVFFETCLSNRCFNLYWGLKPLLGTLLWEQGWMFTLDTIGCLTNRFIKEGRQKFTRFEFHIDIYVCTLDIIDHTYLLKLNLLKTKRKLQTVRIKPEIKWSIRSYKKYPWFFFLDSVDAHMSGKNYTIASNKYLINLKLIN